MKSTFKNLLTLASSLTQLTARSSESVEQMTRALTERLSALGRAHNLVRPLPGSQGRAALLGDLLSVLLAPYDDGAAFSGRIRVAVPRMGIGERTATALAMAFHELATNSAKFGALSCREGALDVTGKSDDENLTIVWSETGGPPVEETPALAGFGSRMVQMYLGGQLGGSIAYDWQQPGLVATVTLPQSALSL